MEDTQQTKICARCKIPKPFSEFNKSKRGRMGLHNHCRSCQKDIRHEWYLKHKDYEIAKNKLPETKARAKLYRDKKYHTNTKWREEHLKKHRERRRLEPAKIKAREQRKKWMSIPHNRIAQALRKRLQLALKFGYKNSSTEQLLGCSFEDAKKYLESKFDVGMTWKNYGLWHIDHILPCDFFDFSKPEHQKLCFNYKNLQPLWKEKNIAKGNKITVDNINQFLEKLRATIAK